MKRRDFFSTAGAALAASALPVRAAGEPLKLKYLLASALYGDMKLAEVLPEVAVVQSIPFEVEELGVAA